MLSAVANHGFAMELKLELVLWRRRIVITTVAVVANTREPGQPQSVFAAGDSTMEDAQAPQAMFQRCTGTAGLCFDRAWSRGEALLPSRQEASIE